MNDDLKKALAGLSVGDYVTATGADTRGHAVTRTGTLLAPPKAVTATRNGARAKGVRLCVGGAGTNPSERSTWTTLFSDSGAVELVDEPHLAEWTNGPLGRVPGVRGNDLGGVRFHFGGKGGKRSAEPSEPVTLVGVTHTSEGTYEVFDVDTAEVLLTCTLQTQVWWLPVGGARQKSGRAEPVNRDDNEHQEQAERGYGKPVRHVRTGEVVGYLNDKPGGRFVPIDEMRGCAQP
ncbi:MULTISPECIES: hypothetical protein [Streptomyces]|uniref:hypothetical protein n=1 Tax=Streptomyces TaxID=1883 RepID=UPI0036F7FDC5